MKILFGGIFSSTTEFQNQLFTNFGSQKKTSSNFCTILSGFKTRRISARLLTSLVVGSVVVRQTRLSNIIGAIEPRDVFLPLQQSQLFKGILHQKIFYRLNLEVPGNQTGPLGTARNDKSLKCFISVAAPRNPMVLRLETPSCCASKPLRRPSKPHGAVPRNPRCAAPQNPWGQILRPKFSSFGGFQAPPTKTSYTTPHYYPKYEIQVIENFLVEDPFNLADLSRPIWSCSNCRTPGCWRLRAGGPFECTEGSLQTNSVFLHFKKVTLPKCRAVKGQNTFALENLNSNQLESMFFGNRRWTKITTFLAP